ncbi:MAG: protein kinase domain-containing protein, partial [Gemmatimonadales bacterium]
MATTLTCLRCGGDLDDGDRYCAACGVESLRCKSCSQQLLPTDLTCPHCGTTAEHAVSADSAETPGEVSADLDDIVARLRRATLGEYDIGRELGRGGMAAVFYAHDLALDRKAAIKVMSPGLVLGEGMTERFKQEAITVAQLHHPSIVSVYSVRQAEGLHFFVMQYVQGRSLEQVLQQARRLPLPIVRSILYQVGSALTYAHRARVVHRDVKPANILIDQDGNAVVTDFGIAKAAERPTRTLTGALVGTPAYMSPEQCAGGEVSGLSDQYSLGAVAYELVTGEPPFAGSTLTVMQAHVERAPRPIPELCAECPPEVAAAIHRMLEKDPAARWPRMVDALTALGAEALPEEHPLRSELARYAAGAGTVPSNSPTPTSPPPRTRRSGSISAPYRSVGGISIMPAPAGFEVGDSFTLVAVLRGQHGTRLPPRAVEWTTDDPTVLRLDNRTALATALAPGTAVVTATCKNVSARLRVDVTAPKADDIVIEPLLEPLQAGEEVRLDATPRDKHGWPVYRPVTWSSADERIAEVTPSGTIAGRAPGTVRLTAAVDDARASVVIPVLPPRVAAVDIVDPPSSLMVGQTLAVRATPLDRVNAPLPGRPIEWSSSDPTIVAVNGGGVVTAVRSGSAVLTATCDDVRAILRIGVMAETPAPTEPARPRVAPRRRSRRARRRAVLAGATVLAAGGLWLAFRPSPLDDRGGAAPAAYASGAVGVDTSPPVAVVITQRPSRSLRPDSGANLVAEARDAAGHVVPGAPIVWSSSDSTIAAVGRATGRVHAIRPGRVLVAAASGAGRDSVVISVRRPGARVPAVGS